MVVVEVHSCTVVMTVDMTVDMTVVMVVLLVTAPNMKCAPDVRKAKSRAFL